MAEGRSRPPRPLPDGTRTGTGTGTGTALLGTPLAREAPACPRCSEGSCRAGRAPEPRLPPRPAAGPEHRERPREDSARAQERPRRRSRGPPRPLCPARGTARLREARHSPYRAVPASPPRLSAPLRSPGCSHRQQGSSRPVPSPPPLPPPLPPRAASRRRGGCSGGRCVGPRRALPREPPPPLPRTHRPPAGALSGSTGREGGKSLSKYRHS